ncbi:MAG: phenylacetic acid degradation operon negative regulatory protein PaaX [Candidatus Accumulibacter sp.]|uniref:phenylacetic acid degradation operon negative regulatory protein PaaX n=1 Tax=Accumulibacter sp. TaxID=2053492 RepID=UPI00287B24E6|nr:phenylacetic acid degradation operon negative regulatory protein PaaX [Accumulibacter sp.]MDS4013444.1 phenylacetic acid degradation operon negative regulatory protein PaaX [Accumulibacter sp.]
MSATAFDHWLTNTLEQTPLRSNSLIVTLFGDAIEPHGGAVLLGSLIDLVAPLGINGRAVRTSVFRLMQEDWLYATPVGRRSEYGLTASGRRRINHAYRRIYDTRHDTWNGQWQIVIVPEGALAGDERETLRRDLMWDGYGTLAPGIYAHPTADASRLRSILMQTSSENKVALLNATSLDGITTTPLREVVQQCWRLDRLAEDYDHFIARFHPAMKWLGQNRVKRPEQHFILRALLIHEFRRVQLRDPQLPEPLLAHNWPGHTARALCRELYEKLLPLSEEHLLATLETRSGALPPADAGLYARFGDLPGTSLTETGRR